MHLMGHRLDFEMWALDSKVEADEHKLAGAVFNLTK